VDVEGLAGLVSGGLCEHTLSTATDPRRSDARRPAGPVARPLASGDRIAPGLSAALRWGGPPVSGTAENLLEHAPMPRGPAPHPRLATPPGRERPLDPRAPSLSGFRIVDRLRNAPLQPLLLRQRASLPQLRLQLEQMGLVRQQHLCGFVEIRSSCRL